MEQSLIQIGTLHPAVRENALKAYQEAVKATPTGVHPIITQGLRSFAESEHLYALGRTIVNPDGKSEASPFGNIVTQAHAGHSWHNYGLAIDFVLLVNGVQVWDVNHDWMTVVDIFKAYGFTWGGDFAGSFKDYPHLENKYGMDTAQALSKYQAKDFIPGTTYININN